MEKEWASLYGNEGYLGLANRYERAVVHDGCENQSIHKSKICAIICNVLNDQTQGHAGGITVV